MRNLKQAALVFIFFTAVSFQGNAPAPKTYNVSLTLDEWVKLANGVQLTINEIRQSDLPSKRVALITDSVLVPLFSHIQSQVGQQMQQEEKEKLEAEKKPAQKKDSTGNKPKKQ
jgi:hypothetical protein